MVKNLNPRMCIQCTISAKVIVAGIVQLSTLYPQVQGEVEKLRSTVRFDSPAVPPPPTTTPPAAVCFVLIYSSFS